MDLEIEAKIKVDSHDAVRTRLRELGAVYLGKARETNRILDRKKKLRKAGCGLRVRQIEVLDGDPGSSSITFKGSVQPSDLKVRSEINVGVDDAEAAARIFEALGFEPFITFEKIRESWQLGDCRIELDEVPLLGMFVEIEGPSEPAVSKIKSELGFDAAKTITQSYVKMLRTVRGSAAAKDTEIRF